MSIVVSSLVSKGRKSFGNLTLRTVRGRLIVSEKRQKASTRLTSLSKAQAVFGMVSIFMFEHASDIQVSFNKSKYGSQRNYFFRLNKKALEAALAPLIPSVMLNATMPTAAEIEDAITAYATANPTEIYRVRLRRFDPVYLTGAWNPNDNPISGGAMDSLGTGTVTTVAGDSTLKAPVAASTSFHAGAKIVRDAGTVTLSMSVLQAGITKEDIKYLTANGSELGTQPTITIESSVAGTLKYTVTALTAQQNATGFSIKGVFYRLTSAYVTEGGVDQNPFG